MQPIINNRLLKKKKKKKIMEIFEAKFDKQMNLKRHLRNQENHNQFPNPLIFFVLFLLF
jgi:hypothetical protein